MFKSIILSVSVNILFIKSRKQHVIHWHQSQTLTTPVVVLVVQIVIHSVVIADGPGLLGIQSSPPNILSTGGYFGNFGHEDGSINPNRHSINTVPVPVSLRLLLQARVLGSVSFDLISIFSVYFLHHQK